MKGYMIALAIAFGIGMIGGSTMLAMGDSWTNQTGYITTNTSWSNNVNITGQLYLPTLSPGQALCLKTNGQIGNCTSVIGITGACTCG